MLLVDDAFGKGVGRRGRVIDAPLEEFHDRTVEATRAALGEDGLAALIADSALRGRYVGRNDAVIHARTLERPLPPFAGAHPLRHRRGARIAPARSPVHRHHSPGVPTVMPEERRGAADGPWIARIEALRERGKRFPEFEKEVAGIVHTHGDCRFRCLK
ncbi:hypothetical protein ACFPTX_00135 [Pseudomonas sp. GCM10022188]|uniref:Orn/Lys/Arg family decarboxylase n=1 Tax=Pseudomonas TaxID=286 RepID=UPI001E5FF032|nr:hypothetical protein [Pseudomonas oryzagri]MCC6077412.1 hypothetical protein [Pseudomonas oryzagri]